MLRHVGFIKEFSIRTWRGSSEPDEAQEEWAELMGEDPFDDAYGIIDSNNWAFCTDLPLWDKCLPDQV
jgi:hypothetical protein